MKLKIDRIISLATLIASLVAIFLVLKKPATITSSQTPVPVAEHAQPSGQHDIQAGPLTQPTQTQSYQASSSQVSQPQVQQPPASDTSASTKRAESPTPSPVASSAKTGPQISSQEISAMLEKTLGAGGSSALTPDSNVGSGTPNIKDQQITTEGDVVHGRFLTEIAGKDVWVSISGHMGEKDGYATFDPTEIKVGDMEVPVSLVNPTLQKKLAEEHDRLKIPDGSKQN